MARLYGLAPLCRRGARAVAFSLAALLAVTAGSAWAEATALEQYMLELVNRARHNPGEEADRYLGGELNEGLPAGTLSAAPQPPLVFDHALNTAADGHTADMIAENFFGHTGTDGTSSHQRMSRAGFPFAGTFGSGENIAARSNFGGVVNAASILQMHINLFVDAGVSGRGHRVNLLNANFESVGLGAAHAASFIPLSSLPSDIVTQNFAYTASQGPYLTGVAYDDRDDDGFYTPGEGLSGLTITAFDAGTADVAGTTSTTNTGGYALPLPSGSYDVEIVGPLGTVSSSGIKLASVNKKLDYHNRTARPSSGSSRAGALVPIFNLLLN